MEQKAEQGKDKARSYLSYHPVAPGQHAVAVILVRVVTQAA